MTASDLTTLIHLVGFMIGIAMYGMLTVMTRRAVARGVGETGIASLAALLDGW